MEKRFPLQFFYTWVLIQMVGCTSPLTPSPFQNLANGTKPFKFDPRQVIELTLIKADPFIGDHWTATFQRRNSAWEITATSENQTILDTQADELFLNHLIDTFQTLRIEKRAPKGALDSFNLAPPIYAIQWKTSQRQYEFFVGSEVKNPQERYLSLDREQPWIANGSTFEMLKHIDSFQFLRKHVWTPFSTDNVDEVEIFHKERSFLYAQREGPIWTDRKHRLYKRDIKTLLDHITQTPSQGFVDLSKQAVPLKKEIQSNPFVKIHLSDRFGKITRLLLMKKKGFLYGLSSVRPHAVFVFQKDFLNHFKDIFKI